MYYWAVARLEVLHTEEQITSALTELSRKLAEEITAGALNIVAFLTVCDGGIHVSSFLQKALSRLSIGVLPYTCNSEGYNGSIASQERKVRLNLTSQDIEQLQSNPEMLLLIVDEISDSGESLIAIQKELNRIGVNNPARTVTLYSREVGEDKTHPDYAAFRVDGTLFLLGWGLDYKNHGAALEFVVMLILDSPDEVINEKDLERLFVETRKRLQAA